jgi:hypothetical protein
LLPTPRCDGRSATMRALGTRRDAFVCDDFAHLCVRILAVCIQPDAGSD